jgi:hypothetical protein
MRATPKLDILNTFSGRQPGLSRCEVFRRQREAAAWTKPAVRWNGGMETCILAGNPKSRSHTLQLATELGKALVPVLGLTSWTTIDLADVAQHLLDWPHPGVDGLSVAMARSRLLITASPTYKASYTGLLKAFLRPV